MVGDAMSTPGEGELSIGMIERAIHVPRIGDPRGDRTNACNLACSDSKHSFCCVENRSEESVSNASRAAIVEADPIQF
jgi:hypothetical protein